MKRKFTIKLVCTVFYSRPEDTPDPIDVRRWVDRQLDSDYCDTTWISIKAHKIPVRRKRVSA